MKTFIFGCIGSLLLIALMAIFEGWIASLLWNWIAPIFWANAPVITIWQAIGILFLLNIVFSVFRNKSK